MDNSSVPEIIRPELDKLGLKLCDVVCCAAADVTPQSGFGDAWALLTKDALYIVKDVGGEGGVRVFSGCTHTEKKCAVPRLCTDKYPLDGISSLEVLMHTVGGALLMRDIHGKETALCRFTSKYTYGFKRLCELYGKLRSGAELTKEELVSNERGIYCEKCGAPYPDPATKVCPHCLNKGSVLARLIAMYRPFIGRMTVVFICICLTTLLAVIEPYLSGTVLFDKVLAKDPSFAEMFGGKPDFAVLLLLCVLAVLAARLTLQLISMLRDSITAVVSPTIVKNVKSRIFASMSRLSLKFYTDAQTGSLLSRVLNDAQELTHFLVDGLPYFLVHSLQIAVSAAFMLMLNWKLALFTVVAIPIMVIVFKYAHRRWRTVHRMRSKRERKLSARINDSITGARVVRAFGSGATEEEDFEKNSTRFYDAEVDVRKQSMKINIITSLVFDIVNYGVMCFGAWLILGGDDSFSVGLLITFMGYISMLQSPIEYFSNFFNWSSAAMTAANRMFEIIDARPEITEAAQPIEREIKGDVEFKNVVFGYTKERDVIKNVSFSVGQGRMLGIVGHSGTGKSTLANLLMRMYDTGSGEILIDGINIKDYSISCLRRNIAIVSQETYILMGSVLDNIRYGRPDADIAEVIRAAKAADAHDFIMAMPDGYDTVIGSSSRQLSGGERQRISIARAILTDPAILILDEATASVDTQTERAIQRAIDELIRGRTTISIAHRLSTLKSADSLIVLEDGKIAERGTGAELLEKGGIYYRLYQLQTKSLAMRGLE